MNNQALRIINKLGLKPLEKEGGFYKETFQSSLYFKEANLDSDYQGDRIFYSCIYYMLTPETQSAIHQLPGDEIFHFYLGDPVEMIQLHEDGNGDIIQIGDNILAGANPQVLVKGKTWQGCKLKKGGEFALMGTTMSPGFDFDDYKHGDLENLIKQYPNFTEVIQSYF